MVCFIFLYVYDLFISEPLEFFSESGLAPDVFNKILGLGPVFLHVSIALISVGFC